MLRPHDVDVDARATLVRANCLSGPSRWERRCGFARLALGRWDLGTWTAAVVLFTGGGRAQSRIAIGCIVRI